jgi:hypothetical protein
LNRPASFFAHGDNGIRDECKSEPLSATRGTVTIRCLA